MENSLFQGILLQPLLLSSKLVFVELISIGFIVGVVSGLLGVGGGVLLTPALSFLGLPLPVAIGTTLTQMIASSFIGCFKHQSKKNIHWQSVAVLGFPGVLGVLLGKNFLVYWQKLDGANEAITKFYITVLFVTSFLVIWKTLVLDRAPDDSKKKNSGRVKGLLVISICIIVGIISGMTGLGGGFFYVPMMIYMIGLPPSTAVGTSLACVFFGSVVGGIGYVLVGLVDIEVAILVACGSMLGSFVGATGTGLISDQPLKIAFAFLIMMAAVSLLLKKLGYFYFSAALLFGGCSAIVIACFALVFIGRFRKPI